MPWFVYYLEWFLTFKSCKENSSFCCILCVFAFNLWVWEQATNIRCVKICILTQTSQRQSAESLYRCGNITFIFIFFDLTDLKKVSQVQQNALQIFPIHCCIFSSTGMLSQCIQFDFCLNLSRSSLSCCYVRAREDESNWPQYWKHVVETGWKDLQVSELA